MRGKTNLSTINVFTFVIVFLSAAAISAPLSKDKDDCVFPDLVMFGDSLSDNGNLFKATNDTLPSSTYYYKGRFTNGRVWIEDLDYMLHANLTDLAYGGAVTNNTFYEKVYSFASNSTLNFTDQIPSLDEQVFVFLPYISQYPSKTIYVFWIGSNDYMRIFDYKLNVTHAEVVSTVIKSISLLISKGAKNFLVLNVPPVQLTPSHNKLENRTVIQNLIEGYNLLLNGTLSELSKLNPHVSINLFDTYGLLEKVVKNPKSYGYKNVVDHCLNATSSTGKRGLEEIQNYFLEKRASIPKHEVKKHKHKDDDDDYVTKDELAFRTPGACENPDEYLYWDNVHPTRRTHRILAARLEEFICAEDDWKL